MLGELSKRAEVGFAFQYWKLPRLLTKKEGNVTYYAIPAAAPCLDETDEGVRAGIRAVYEEYRADVVHVFGTETPFTLEVLRCVDTARTVVSITGLSCVCGGYVYGGLRRGALGLPSLRDLLKGGLARQERSFARRGVTEIQALRLAEHVIGRTAFDRACVEQINPSLRYHFCNEMLRDGFWRRRWELASCTRHTLFVSAGNTPYKGVHQVLEALPIIRRTYPDVRLVVAGSDVTAYRTVRDRLKITTYGRYLRRRIKKYGLETAVRFIGPQDAEGMARQYLRAHVFVLPSAIENSPNSLGEAMFLGVPCVASAVGGVQDMLKDREEGFLYPFDEPYMLAYYVTRLFGSDELAERFSQAARSHAAKTHDRERILKDLTAIYHSLLAASPSQATKEKGTEPNL
jgi:glycosyltransferase involved in cell wall biosynthesis